MTRYYNDLADHDRSVAQDRLAMAAWEAAQDADTDTDTDFDYEDEEDDDDGCPLCGRARCSGYCM
jgi:hypothetical protein